MRIGCDFDEVLAGFIKELAKYHNDTYGTSLTRDKFHTHNFWEVWGGTREEAIEKVDAFRKTAYFENIKPIPGSVEGVEKLRAGNELIVITGRQDYLAEATYKWLDEFFPKKVSEVHFTSSFHPNKDKRKKHQVCYDLGIDIFIEDALDWASECAANCTLVILLDAPWNQSEKLPKNVLRAFSWDEIVDKVSKQYPLQQQPQSPRWQLQS